MDYYLQERISAGAQFLDEHLPSWETKIDLELLDMQDEEQCILGQALGDYSVAIIQFDLSSAKQVQLGFAALLESDFPELSRSWKELILERQAALGAKGGRTAAPA